MRRNHRLLKAEKINKDNQLAKENSRLRTTCINGAIACIIMLVCIGTLITSNIVLKRELGRVENNLGMVENNLAIIERVLQNVMEENESYSKAFRVKVTGYHPDSGGINSDSDPSMTATMTPHKAGYTCAISTALVEEGWLGKEIYIEGFGMVLANDRLAKGIKGYQIDLCKASYKDAMKVGVNKNVLATLVSRKFIKQKLEEK